MLPQIDVDYLNEVAPEHTTSQEAQMVCVLLPEFPVPPGFTCEKSDLLLRLPVGYPDIAPDMWWFSPAIVRNDNVTIPATNATETHLGRQWQRWSRHLSTGQWKSGIDSLESYLSIVKRELNTAAIGVAA